MPTAPGMDEHPWVELELIIELGMNLDRWHKLRQNFGKYNMGVREGKPWKLRHLCNFMSHIKKIIIIKSWIRNAQQPLHTIGIHPDWLVMVTWCQLERLCALPCLQIWMGAWAFWVMLASSVSLWLAILQTCGLSIACSGTHQQLCKALPLSVCSVSVLWCA